MNALLGAVYAFALAGSAYLLCELGLSLTRRRINRSGNRPYLERVGREQTPEQAWRDRLRGTWRVRLHLFKGPDDAGHHNHPFAWAFSINLSALWGAYYVEEVLSQRTIAEGKPGFRRFACRLFNWIPLSKYHRIVELHPGLFGLGVVTLFVTGPRVSSWGFWESGRGHIPWRQYNKEKGINAERD
jgi:hypothetical protein